MESVGEFDHTDSEGFVRVLATAGKEIYYERCFMCHGENVVSGGVLPDLRGLTKEKHDIWDSIVRDVMLTTSSRRSRTRDRL